MYQIPSGASTRARGERLPITPVSLNVKIDNPGLSSASTTATKGSRRPLASYESGGKGGPGSGSLGRATSPGLTGTVAGAAAAGVATTAGGLGGPPPQPLSRRATVRASQPARWDVA